MKFPKLFEPCRVGRLELRNRIVQCPVTTQLVDDGAVTDRFVDFYAELARGGASLVIVEDSIVDAPVGKHSLNDAELDDDKHIPGMSRVAQAIKKEGAVACVQISHAGRIGGQLFNGYLSITRGQIPVAPSKVTFPVPGWVVPHELTIEEIIDIENKFADTAWRAKEAGFDMISLHATHGYLIQQFLSPYSNTRQDEYGGDPERRLRFFLEIIEKVKKRIGDDFPLMCRLAGIDMVRGGLTIEDARQTARKLEAHGLNCINPDTSFDARGPLGSLTYEYFPSISSAPDGRSPRGELVHIATAVKDVVSIPIIACGRIITPEQAEKILVQGRADLIGIARGLLADPEWPKKAQEGRENEIRYCISCAQGCGGVTISHMSIHCLVNPALGRERELAITPADNVKTVFIAGGGPAGLETARVAATRGHKVTLYEKNKLGGQMNLATALPGKSGYQLFIEFERNQLSKLGVTIEKKELTPEIIQKEKPDAIVLATGALPAQSDIPGSDNEHVVTVWQVLEGYTPKKKVAIIGGKQIGAETAEYLTHKGNEVTIIESTAKIAKDAFPRSRETLLRSLELLNVKMLTEATVKEITKSGVIIVHKGKRRTIDADTVVLAPGNKPNNELAAQLEKLGIKYQTIGDCGGVGKLIKAVKEGFFAGMAL